MTERLNGSESGRPVSVSQTRAVRSRDAVTILLASGLNWTERISPACLMCSAVMLSVQHIGPVAQDFYGTFGAGVDDKHIAPLDANGVALAAIQGLNQKVEERLQQKETEITELKQRLEKLERLMNQNNGGAQ